VGLSGGGRTGVKGLKKSVGVVAPFFLPDPPPPTPPNSLLHFKKTLHPPSSYLRLGQHGFSLGRRLGKGGRRRGRIGGRSSGRRPVAGCSGGAAAAQGRRPSDAALVRRASPGRGEARGLHLGCQLHACVKGPGALGRARVRGERQPFLACGSRCSTHPPSFSFPHPERERRKRKKKKKMKIHGSVITSIHAPERVASSWFVYDLSKNKGAHPNRREGWR
jgi:hypothetical protein